MIFQRYNNFQILFFFLFSSIFFSCKEDARSKRILSLTQGADSFMTKSIRFAPLFLDHRNSLDTMLWNKKNKIILYLDSLDCTTCTFNEIRKWNSYNRELKKLNTEIIIICNHPDIKAILDVKSITHVKYPVFFDVDKQFKSTNAIPQERMFQTFVVGNLNQVIWVGLPIRSKKSWEDFCTVIMTINNSRL